jgi:hypothetical protein
LELQNRLMINHHTGIQLLFVYRFGLSLSDIELLVYESVVAICHIMQIKNQLLFNKVLLLNLISLNIKV